MKAISMKSLRTNQSGAVSLFVVIFATLLITVVTVGFLRLMLSDQMQATNNDLSQSAYDSAQAGVEDAKRVLLRYQKICNEESRSECDSLANKISDSACNGALSIGGVIPAAEGSNTQNTPEIPIQQTTSSDSGDALLDQAYTCVTIDLETEDYLGTLSSGQSKLVPLVGVDDITKVKIEWFTSEDLGDSDASNKVLDYRTGTDNTLYAQANWKLNRPSLLRAQLMQFGSDGFKLSDFDTSTTTSPTESNANTLFLYPIAGAVASDKNRSTPLSFNDNSQRATDDKGPSSVTTPAFPSSVECIPDLGGGGWACVTTITLPKVINGGDRTAFLRLTPFYNSTHFRVTMQNTSGAVTFKGVQPEIDSTGRANDLFRRVSSRVDLIDTSFPYPEAAVDLTGNFCKDFGVTKDKYYAGNCTP